MLAVLLGAQDNRATGATIGRWIDGNFVGAVAIAAVAATAVVLTVLLLARGYGRQRRKNRRMRRYHEITVQRHLEALNAKLDELRGDVSQLSELEDHVVAQLRLMREALGLVDVEGLATAPRSALPRRPLFAEPVPGTTSSERAAPSSGALPSGALPSGASSLLSSSQALAAASVTPSASPRLRRSSLLAGPRGAASGSGRQRLFPGATDPEPQPGTGQDQPPSPALLVETGEPLAYSTRQR